MKARLQLVAKLDGHQDAVWACAWHPDGTRLATCGTDRSIRLWAPAATIGIGAEVDITNEWRCVQRIDDDHHRRTVRSVAFSQVDGGRCLASCSFDGTVCVFVRGAGGQYEFLATLEGHENEVKSVAWSWHAPLLATCGRDKSVWVWEMGGGEVDASFHVGGGGDEDDFQCLAVLQEHEQDVKCVRWSPAQAGLLLSCSYDDTLRLWREQEDDGDWSSAGVLDAGGVTAWCADFSVDGRRMVSAGDDGVARFWEAVAPPSASDSAPQFRLVVAVNALTANGDAAPLYSVSWSPHLDIVAVGARDNSIRLLRPPPLSTSPAPAPTPHKAWLSVLNAHEADVNCVAWNPNAGYAQLLASCSDDGTARIWRLCQEQEHEEGEED